MAPAEGEGAVPPGAWRAGPCASLGQGLSMVLLWQLGQGPPELSLAAPSA